MGTADPAEALTLQMLAWLAEHPRSYAEVMDAWRSSCPRLTIWEDALAAGLVAYASGRPVAVTERGRRLLAPSEPVLRRSA